MPEIGEVKQDKELGYKNPGTKKYIWSACIDCGKERWVHLLKGRPKHPRCGRCAQTGELSHGWKGGRRVVGKGYITIRLYPDDFFYSMADKLHHYVFEHRLVVAKALGRCLHSWEIVHHKGAKYPKGSIENKQDNRYPENLQLVTDDRHKQITILENKIRRQDIRIKTLEARVKLLERENDLASEGEGLTTKYCKTCGDFSGD